MTGNAQRVVPTQGEFMAEFGKTIVACSIQSRSISPPPRPALVVPGKPVAAAGGGGGSTTRVP